MLAFLPNRKELPELVNGEPWRGGVERYPNVVVCKPFVSVQPRLFKDFVERHIIGRYKSSSRFEARFLPLGFDRAIKDLLGAEFGGRRPESLGIPPGSSGRAS